MKDQRDETIRWLLDVVVEKSARAGKAETALLEANTTIIRLERELEEAKTSVNRGISSGDTVLVAGGGSSRFRVLDVQRGSARLFSLSSGLNYGWVTTTLLIPAKEGSPT